MKRELSGACSGFLLVLGVALGPTGVYAGEGDLPPAAAQAVKAVFPTATITEVERDRENGAVYYDVSLKVKGKIETTSF